MARITFIFIFFFCHTLFGASKEKIDFCGIDNDIWFKKAIPESAEKVLILKSSKSKESVEKYCSKALLAKLYRVRGKDSRALEFVSDCSDFQRIIPKDKDELPEAYLEAFLELAHLKAVDKEKPAVRESMKMLNYASVNTTGFGKPLTLFKYAQVLLDLKEAKKALAYLDDALKALDEFSAKVLPKSAGSSIDQEGERLRALARKIGALREKILSFQLEVKTGILAEEFGEGYAMYFKMRTLYSRRQFDQAVGLCEKLVREHPGTMYCDAGKLYNAYCLQKTGSLKKAQSELQKFIADSPNGLYRGEAWMTLGKMALENDFDEKKASECYAKALEWFRNARESKDAVDIYSLSEKLTAFAVPQKKLSGIDEWNRKIYRELLPENIANEKVAPWYVDEMETECLFMVGFFLYIEGDYEKSKECFLQIKKLDSDLAQLDSRNIPNALWRLESACNVGKMIFNNEQRKFLKGDRRLLCSIAELYYLLEKQEASLELFNRISSDPKSSDPEKAIALIGTAACLDFNPNGKARAQECLQDAARLAERYDIIASDAVFRLACSYQSSSSTQEKAILAFNEYLGKYQGAEDTPRALFRLAVLYKASGKNQDFAAVSERLLASYPDSCYAKALKKMEEEE